MFGGVLEFLKVWDFFYGRYLLRFEILFFDQCIKCFIEKEYIMVELLVICWKNCYVCC